MGDRVDEGAQVRQDGADGFWVVWDRCLKLLFSGDRVPTVTVSHMPLKNIVRAFALMFATALSASACDPPDADDKPQQRGAESGERTPVTTELHKAAYSNPSPAVLEVLLKAGADVNAEDEHGRTPLHLAAGKNPSPAVLEVLLKAGADVNAKDPDGVTPLHWAAAKNPWHVRLLDQVRGSRVQVVLPQGN